MGDFFLIMTQPFCTFCIYKTKQNYKMKKILALICVFILTITCSVEESTPPVHYVLVPIQNVDIPEVMYVETSYNIVIEYPKLSSCHGFDGFFYQKDEFTRTISVQNFVVEKSDCVALTNQISTENMSFQPTEPGTYLFKFWKGKDDSGNDVFLEIERTVVTN